MGWGRFGRQWDARRFCSVYGSPMRRRLGLALTTSGDLLLAVALAVLGLCELFVRSLNADWHGPRALNVLVVLLFALPVVWRRRAPLAALVAFWVPTQIWLDVLYGAHANLPVEPFLVLLILVYSAASYAAGNEQRVVIALLAALYVSEVALLLAGLKGLGNVVPGLVFISLAYALGRGVRGRRAHAASLEHRTVVLEEERESLARQAVVEERDRIARELHDVIAHSVSVMIVQAGAAERLLDHDPERARDALEAIRGAGSETLDELRRLLGLLRDTPTGDPSAEPQPGLARLDALVKQAEASGLAVDCVVDGAQRQLPVGIDLAAYRIVQEALTNIRKHAGAATAHVQISFSQRELDLRITDDGGGHGHNTNGSGHGLIGMRERVTLYGGTLTSGPRSSGGFEVRARIPLHGASA
jgi:signal transduction histidine kinase